MRLALWAAVPIDAGGFYMWDVSIAHQDWQDIAMSADGSKIYACSLSRTGLNGIWRSLDSGVTWSADWNSSGFPLPNCCTAVRVSSDGTTILVASSRHCRVTLGPT